MMNIGLCESGTNEYLGCRWGKATIVIPKPQEPIEETLTSISLALSQAPHKFAK